MQQFFYVSRSNLKGVTQKDEVARIVDVARFRNQSNDVTGCLLSTASFFAQYIEGPPRGLQPIIDSIRADIRHTDLTVISHDSVDERVFGSWSLAYEGASHYVEKQIKVVIGVSASIEARALSAANLMLLMRGLLSKTPVNHA